MHIVFVNDLIRGAAKRALKYDSHRFDPPKGNRVLADILLAGHILEVETISR
jgi:hypothetical protein